MGEVSGSLRYLFTRYLREGVFPSLWKEARLVLFPKEGRDPDDPSAYRPLCLLDEVGKLMERVLVGPFFIFYRSEGREMRLRRPWVRSSQGTVGLQPKVGRLPTKTLPIRRCFHLLTCLRQRNCIALLHRRKRLLYSRYPVLAAVFLSPLYPDLLLVFLWLFLLRMRILISSQFYLLNSFVCVSYVGMCYCCVVFV